MGKVKGLQVLLLDSMQSRLKRIARELSKLHLICSLESCLSKAHKKLSEVRYEAVFVSQSVAMGKTEKFCHELHSNDSSVVIVVAIIKQDTKLELKLLDMGVDDVVADLTHWKIVAKRIFVRLINRSLSNSSDNTIQLGGVLVDTKHFEVWNRGKIKTITPGQTELLQYFVNNAGRAISRKEAAEVLWAGSVVDPMGKNLDMQVSKIRGLIEDNSKKPKLIRTIRAVGYQFVPR